MNRKRFLRVYGYTAEQWASRWGIEPVTRPCQGCGTPLTTDVPFAYRDLRGLMAPTCACGQSGVPYCLVRASGDILDGRSLP